MGTYDEILNGLPGGTVVGLPNATSNVDGNSTLDDVTTKVVQSGNAGGNDAQQKVTETEQAKNKSKAPKYTVRTNSVDAGQKAVTKEEQPPTPLTYEQMAEKISQYKPQTDAELEKEKKKQKRDSVFAAIGDGIAALSNIYFASKGAPNSYDGKVTMSGANQARWDKLKKERQDDAYAHYSNIMRARQMDEQKANSERSWARQLGIDKLEEERYNAEKQHRSEQEAKSDDRWDKEFKQREDQYRKQNALAAADDARSDKQVQNNYDVGMARANATSARAVRGKQIAFSNGEGKQFSIYENVWKGSMQQVFNAIAYDWVELHKKDRNKYPFLKPTMTASEKDDFVKRNWSVSPRATAIMATLAQLDPATMTSSTTEEEEDFDQYKQQ